MGLRARLWVSLEKKIPDLFLLSFCLDQLQYLSRHSLIFAASLLVALESRMISSAYMTWVIAGPPMLALTPLMAGS